MSTVALPRLVYFNLWVAGDPVAQGSLNAIGGRIFHVKSARLNRWRKAIATAAAAEGIVAFAGPVSIDLQFVLRRPKAHYTRGGAVKLSSSPLPVGRPDLDKLVRAVLDALTGTAYSDDAAVTELRARKTYVASLSHEPGCWVQVTYTQ